MATRMASSSSPRARSDNSALCRTRSSSQSSSSGFASSRGSITRSSSPTRVSMYGSSISPGRRSMSVTKQSNGAAGNVHGNGNGNGNGVVSRPKKTCMCAPTTHPGSFRCSLHKNSPRGGPQKTPSFSSNSRRQYLMRSAIANSLIRNGVVEGKLMKTSLSALIRPSSNEPRHRETFQPRPSRLSVMSRAQDS